MSKTLSAFNLPYITCRNISGPEDEAAGRRVYSGYAPGSSVLNLEDDENVREYLVDAPGKQKKSPTLVHQAIRKTLIDNPDQFSILNGGLVIVARGAEVDDKEKVLKLKRPSIINGSQTQGELVRYFGMKEQILDFVDPSICYQLIVTNDDDLIAEISIARNFQNDVRAISIAGRRGQLDELESRIQAVFPDAKLRKSETDLVADGEYWDTEKLIQVMLALVPHDLWGCLDDKKGERNKTFTYSHRTRCLKIFQDVVDRCSNSDEREDAKYRELYEFFLDIAPSAWALYEKWKQHPEFKGSRLRSIVRDGREIVEVPDGIVFPILASLSAFVKRGRRGWKIEVPKNFDEGELVEVAVQAYKEIADSNPQSMGKSKACYSSLLRVTSIYARLLS